ncbi:hypothetical protein BVX95_00645 [archaeon D22]|nr:hypothetical protein BVX95_00645 [archaeon D22]
MEEGIFEYSLEKLNKHFAMKNISKKLALPSYNKLLGIRMCEIAFKMAAENAELFGNSIKDFIDYSMDFLKLQIELEKTGQYKYKTFEEIQKNVYENKNVMDNMYLNGLLLSQSFWTNHNQILSFFIDKFSKNNKENGSVLEVPIGTGIFMSEFSNHNQMWKGTGYDLSESSVQYAKKVLKINSPDQDIKVSQKNIFEINNSTKYDRIICGELLEHLEEPEKLLQKLNLLVKNDGKVFLTTAIWAAAIDHIYLFRSVEEVKQMLLKYFKIEDEIVLNVFDNKKPTDSKTPINYACILSKRL